MQLPIINLENKEIGKKDLPSQFKEDIRPDIIKRAVLTIEDNLRQPYGPDPLAGKRASAKISRRRHNYRGSYGYGISRVPRKILSRHGTRMYWVGAFSPGTVGGRRAHPPKAEKIWQKKINKKERRKAIRSALSATIDKESVKGHGHIVPDNYPFIVDTKIESLTKTKEVKKSLECLGLKEELQRSSKKSVRPGKGTMRGRPYKKRKGPLIVVSKICPLMKATKNIPGIDVVTIKKLNAKLLAPGAVPGRLTLFTNDAIDVLEKEKLFM
jgi:large subunit ribosomal protein L4e